MKVKITEQGWGGHFICANRCNFRRNTLVEYGEKRIVVSTVGNMSSSGGDKFDKQIGANRYYETMVFWAKWEKPYWEADVNKQVDLESDWAIGELEFETDLKANKMHENVVKEISDLIKVINEPENDFCPCGNLKANESDVCEECL